MNLQKLFGAYLSAETEASERERALADLQGKLGESEAALVEVREGLENITVPPEFDAALLTSLENAGMRERNWMSAMAAHRRDGDDEGVLWLWDKGPNDLMDSGDIDVFPGVGGLYGHQRSLNDHLWTFDGQTEDSQGELVTSFAPLLGVVYVGQAQGILAIDRHTGEEIDAVAEARVHQILAEATGVYAAGGSHVYAFEPDMHPRWNKQYGQVTSIARSGGNLIATLSHTMRSLDIMTGEETDITGQGGHLVASPGGTVYSHNELSGMLEQDPNKGDGGWTVQTFTVPLTLAASNELVYTGRSEGMVNAYDASSGEKRWSHDFSSEGPHKILADLRLHGDQIDIIMVGKDLGDGYNLITVDALRDPGE